MISTDGNHYPERLGTLVVINAPAMLSWTWKIIQGFLDDVQKAKIGIYGTDPNEWMPVLFKIIDKDQVPVSYGGTLLHCRLHQASKNIKYSNYLTSSEDLFRILCWLLFSNLLSPNYFEYF